MMEATEKQQNRVTILGRAIDDGSERSSSSNSFSENDSDLENITEHPKHGSKHQDRALGENVLGDSQRVNFEVHGGDGTKGTSTAKPVVLVVEEQKGAKTIEHGNDEATVTEAFSEESATQEDLMDLFSPTSEGNDTEERSSEGETDQTTLGHVQCQYESKDQSTAKGHHIEVDDTMIIYNAPSDEHSHLLKQVREEQPKSGSKDTKAANGWGRRSSFGSRYKSGLISGLSLESKSGAFPKPNVERPQKLVGMQQLRSRESTTTAKLTSPRTSSPKVNTRNLLKMYNVSLHSGLVACNRIL